MSTEPVTDQAWERPDGSNDEARRKHEEDIRRQVMEAMGSRRSKATASPHSSGARTAGVDGPAQRAAGVDGPAQLRRMEAESGGKLLPVLCGPSSGRGQALLDFGFLVHQPLVPDKVFVALAFTGPTPHGTIGMDWFGRAHHQQLGEPSFEHLLAFAGLNLKQGLNAALCQYDRGNLVRWERDEHFAGSAVTMPYFYDHMSEALGAQRLAVGIPSSDELWVADADSVGAADVRGYTLEAGCDNDFLGPTVLLVERDGAHVLAEGQI